MDRARTTGGRHAQCPAGHVCHQPSVIDSRVPGSDWAKECLLVEFRKDPAALLSDWSVRSQAEERDCRPLGFRNPRHDVGRPTAAGSLTDPDTAAHPGIHICHERRRALVPGHHMPNPVPRIVKGIVEGHPGVTGQPEHILNAALYQGFDQCPSPLHGCLPPSFYRVPQSPDYTRQRDRRRRIVARKSTPGLDASPHPHRHIQVVHIRAGRTRGHQASCRLKHPPAVVVP